MCFDVCQFAFIYISNTVRCIKIRNTHLSSVSTNVYTLIFKFNVIIVRLISMLMKTSFNLCVVIIVRNLIYCIDLSRDAMVFT